MNIEKKNDRNRISAPRTYGLRRAKPVISATRKVVKLVSNMALRLCTTGPGESVMLAHKAPKDKVNPIWKWPKRAKSKEGKSTPSVIRKPSEKYWLNKKYWIARAWFFMS